MMIVFNKLEIMFSVLIKGRHYGKKLVVLLIVYYFFKPSFSVELLTMIRVKDFLLLLLESSELLSKFGDCFFKRSG